MGETSIQWCDFTFNTTFHSVMMAAMPLGEAALP